MARSAFVDSGRRKTHLYSTVEMLMTRDGPAVIVTKARYLSRIAIWRFWWGANVTLLGQWGHPLSLVDRGIQWATKMLPLKRGGDVAHSVNSPPPCGGYVSCWRTCFCFSSVQFGKVNIFSYKTNKSSQWESSAHTCQSLIMYPDNLINFSDNADMFSVRPALSN